MKRSILCAAAVLAAGLMTAQASAQNTEKKEDLKFGGFSTGASASQNGALNAGTRGASPFVQKQGKSAAELKSKKSEGQAFGAVPLGGGTVVAPRTGEKEPKED